MNKKLIVAVAVILVAAVFFAANHVHGRSPKHNAAPQKETGMPQPASSGSQSKPAAAPVAHASYRPLNLALLAGGFTSIEEFQQRVANDPVLHSFYGSCPDSKASMRPLPDDILVFVTFRRGNEIHWTRRPMLIHAGEYVLTLCGKTVLARCGNLISWSPMQPSEDVPPSLLDIPTDEYRASDPVTLTAESTSGPAPAGALAALPAAGGHRFFFIPPFYVPSSSSGHTSTSAPTPSAPLLPAAPVAPPSPLEGDEFSDHQALYTLLLGFFAIALIKLFTR